VDLGAYDLKVNGLTVGRGNGNVDSNTASGNYALASNTTGAYNTATGLGALKANTTGDDNTASGFHALYSNTIGYFNTASGNYALASNTEGNFNMASGGDALVSNTTGSENTAIGVGADVGSGVLTNATAIGAFATVLASNTIQLGATNVAKVITSGTLTAGTVTYPNTAGTNGQVLTTDGSGIASWASAPTYSVGLNPALGGYVFYVTTDGKHGLVVATQDQSSSSSWSNAQDKISDPSSHNTNGQKFTDWRMPTKYELNLLYSQKSSIGIGDFAADYYWSSTADGYTLAFCQTFFNGTQSNSPIISTTFQHVRAIRAF
jgi:hypothetical protein